MHCVVVVGLNRRLKRRRGVGPFTFAGAFFPVHVCVYMCVHGWDVSAWLLSPPAVGVSEWPLFPPFLRLAGNMLVGSFVLVQRPG